MFDAFYVPLGQRKLLSETAWLKPLVALDKRDLPGHEPSFMSFSLIFNFKSVELLRQ